jgi:hypothetical protein
MGRFHLPNESARKFGQPDQDERSSLPNAMPVLVLRIVAQSRNSTTPLNQQSSIERQCNESPPDPALNPPHPSIAYSSAILAPA